MPSFLPTSLTPAARRELAAGARAMAPQLLGIVPFGLVTGVACVASGLTPLQAIGLSLFTFSGMAQLVVAQLTAVGAPPWVILVAVAVVSLRLIMYSAAIAPQFAHLPRGLRWFLASLLTDQSFAIGSTQYPSFPPERPAHWHYLGVGLASFIPWQLAVAMGALLGSRIPAAWSLDFAVTLSFIVLVRPAIRRHADYVAAAAAAIIVLIAAGLPYRLALVVATFAGIAAGLAALRLLPEDKVAPT
jgi:4-azaleucine resistance transporter AzlC